MFCIKHILILFATMMILLMWDLSVVGLSTSAQSAIVINADTGEILYEQNAREPLPMASTTKIMTALLLAEQEDLSTQIRCTKEMVTVEGSSMGLQEGDYVTYRDLLYGMLLASGNDAANTTAIALGGSLDDFAEQMNRKALMLGLDSTHFVSPSGLDAVGHYTTAFDLSKLAAYAIHNAVFLEACSSDTATLCYGNPPYRRTLTNHNRLLKSYDGLIGVKTGFTKKAGRCLVTAATRGSATVIAVTLHDPNDWSDHRSLLDYGFSSLQENEYSGLVSCPAVSVIGSDRSAVATTTDGFFLSTKPENRDRITCKTQMDAFAYAPVEVGQKVGEVTYYFENTEVGKAILTAAESAECLPEKQIAFSQKVWRFFGLMISRI